MRWKNSRLVLTIGAFVTLITPLFGQSVDSSAVFKAAFLNHEEQPYTVSLTDYTLKKGDTLSLERLSFSADVRVVDSTANRYLMEWRFHSFTINSDSRLLLQLVSFAKPVTVTCLVSPVGMLDEFLSWESLSTCFDEGFKQLLPQYAQRTDTAAKRDIQRAYTLRTGLESTLLRTIRLFHQLHGYGYRLGEIVDVPTPLALPGLSEPIVGIVRKSCTQLDNEQGTAVVSTVTQPNQAALIEALAKLQGATVQQKLLLNQKIMGSTVFDLKTGWVFYTFELLESGFASGQVGQFLELKHASTNFNQ